MPFANPGTFVLVMAAAGVLGLVIWVRRRRQTVALPDSLTTESAISQPEVQPGSEGSGAPLERLLRTDLDADPGEGILAPDPWT